MQSSFHPPGMLQRPPSPSPSQLPPIPGSPTYSYASTAQPSLSQFNFPLPPPPRPAHAVLTKADLESSQTAYADLLTTAKGYRLALASLSTAASAFGSALEACARLKEARAEPLGPINPGLLSNGNTIGGSLSGSFHAGGPGNNNNNNNNNNNTNPPPLNLNNNIMSKNACTADTLLTVAGLQHLVANHQHILSETVYRSFEVPLLHELDKWRGAVEDEEESYASAVAAQSKEINRLEKAGLKLHKQKRRDVNMFRNHLVELTTKLDGLTYLHGEHARTLLRESQETSVRIVEASCSLVRAEVDIFESLARKGWTGGGLEEVLERGVDLFANEGDGGMMGGEHVMGGSLGKEPGYQGGGGGGGAGSKLFSILPPKSILANDNSGVEGGGGGGTVRGQRGDSLLIAAGGGEGQGDRYQSLAGLVTLDSLKGIDRDGRDGDSVFSESQQQQQGGQQFNRSRGVGAIRPFSPQPQHVRMNPDKLLGTSLEVDNDGGLMAGMEKNNKDEEDDKGNRSETDDDEAHPWRNEGLEKRRSSSSSLVSETGNLLLRDRSLGANLGDPQERVGDESGWSVAGTERNSP
ncbi:hypothetical protein QBC36DRAFT_372691 [Triangularia setosa]|uniref:Uncharacterized protein n=1 Tax=Triangularia setosa TaxID=2587417 RepID=A0AAN6W888_9PEZI|nr:hypothetical protein QBC36DRAFT_372691 [Podospora setosa]